MCTAMALSSKNKECFFGRTMDFSYELDPEIFIVPKDYEWRSLLNNKIKNKYKFIGIGQNIGQVVFVDGVNEEGLGVAVLYFQGCASYDNPNNNQKISIGSTELVKFLLGNCSNINDVVNKVKNINIIGVEDAITKSIAPLHWIVVDKSGKCITIEKTKKELEIFNNPIKVLSNSPDFSWHMTNLKNYLNLSPKQELESKWGNIIIKPFGQGAGSWGLPGDFTSPSRFVRVSFLKSFANTFEIEDKMVNQCFNIMKNVTVPKGVVVTDRGTNDYTQYTAFININNGDYYFNTYDNHQILKVNINDLNSNEITSLGKLKRLISFEHI